MPKSAKKKKAPGPVSWVSGTKLEFLGSQKDEWRAAHASGNLQKFGRIMAVRFWIRYGEGDIFDDLLNAPTIPTAEEVKEWETAEATVVSQLGRDESQSRVEKQRKFVQKMIQWYRQDSRVIKQADLHIVAKALALSLAPKKKKKQKRRPQLIQVFTRLYWASPLPLQETNLKTLVDTEYDVVTAAYQVELAQAQTPPPAKLPSKYTHMGVQRRIVKAAWNAAPPEIHTQISDLVDSGAANDIDIDPEAVDDGDDGDDGDEDEDEAENHKNDGKEKTPADYLRALNNGTSFLEHTVAVIQKEFGLVCTILLAGPLGKDGGAIGVRSAHAGTTLTSGAQWPAYDSSGFAQVEKTLIKFAEKCFSSKECVDWATANANPNVDHGRSSTPNVTPPDNTISTVPTTPATPATPLASLPHEPLAIPQMETLRQKGVNSVLEQSLSMLIEQDRIECLHALAKMSLREVEVQCRINERSVRLWNAGMGNYFSDETSILYEKRLTTGGREVLDKKEAEMEEARRIGNEERQVMQDVQRTRLALLKGTEEPKEPMPPGTPPEHTTDDGALVNSQARPAKHSRPDDDNSGDNEDGDDDLEGLEWDDIHSDGWYSELTKAFEGFKRGRLWPSEWLRLIHAFFCFQAKSGFENSNGALSTKSRPEVVGDFMKGRRRWDATWDIKDTQTVWWAWWKGLQPAERIVNGKLVRPERVDWVDLGSKCGQNGILLVLGTLLWWGDVVADDATQNVDWLLAVRDVTWAVDDIIRNVKFTKASSAVKAPTSRRKTKKRK